MRSLQLVLTAVIAVNAQTTPPATATAKAPGGDVASLLLPLMAKGIPFGPVPKGCSEFEILIARGTGEPGPFGVVVGDLLVESVTKAIPGSRGYAVQYPANLNISSSAPTGVDDTISRLNNQHKECPNQKFALVGYSQGAGVMHSVFAASAAPYPGGPKERPKLNQDVIPSILALVMFGDPGYKGGTSASFLGGTNKFPQALFDRLRENCASHDPVCDPSPGGFESHLEYVKNPWQKDSVDFIIAAFKGQPLSRTPRTAEEAAAAAKANGPPAHPASAPAPAASVPPKAPAKAPRMLI